MDIDPFVDRCLLLDLEVSRGGKVFAVGAVFRGRQFNRGGNIDLKRTMAELDSFSRDAEYVLGHNILRHDLPLLRTISPSLSLLEKPSIDTLFFSPLAFPENPYHRLIKDYKLVRDSVNDPVADARLAADIFGDQWQRFAHSKNLNLLSFYHFCFSGHKEYAGMCEVFSLVGARPLTETEATDIFAMLVAGYVCRDAVKEISTAYVSDPERRIALSYCTAWLLVAGGNSVVPPWVLHAFPDVPAIIRQLRDIPCGHPQCIYCKEMHDPVGQLQRYFGFDGFRSEPQTPSGDSLQQKIVEAAMADRPLFAVLPTGGGKSICYQLPALIRYQRRGVLTLVISPLQALMKDQVDNLRSKTGAPNTAALYGMLTAPERGEVLNGVRLGDIAILYISPEQLRNRSFRETISQREIGCWIFDEAHCLSKWGHDFRPDYLYAARFIKEFTLQQNQSLPPIQCFTATAKLDVQQEIIDYFNSNLGQKLAIFESSVERKNLRFEVQTVSRAEKYAAIHRILSDRLPASGSAIIYRARRKWTEDTRDILRKQDWPAEAFHAGLDPAQKRHIQDNFMAGATRIICATNAFGMGIDKDNVRLVIHADIPGSLENYIQEAGRAGRDQKNADCILLYDDQDIESQFGLEAFSELSRKDIAQILRGLRRTKRNKQGDAVITAGELLRDDDLNISFDMDERGADTKVLTAVAWLERAGFLQRNENRTQVFQGRPLVKNQDEARQKIAPLNLSERQKERWLAILEALMNADSDQGFSADELAERIPPSVSSPDDRKTENGLTESRKIIRALHDMASHGLLKQTMMLTAFVRYKVKNHSGLLMERICQLEERMLDALQEEAPDADNRDWQTLSLRRLNQRMIDGGEKISSPEILRNLLVSLSQDGQGLAGARGSIDLRYCGQDQFKVKLQRDWQNLRATAERRRAIAKVILAAILGLVPAHTPASADLLVEFSSEELLQALRNDNHLRSCIRDPLAAMDRALMYLHEQRVITLQKGLAVFRQAMTVRVFDNQKGRRYTEGDYETLSRHYAERVFQIHVMNEYARKAIDKIGQALAFVFAYFTQDKIEFVKRFFADRKTILERATSQQSYQKIVDDLQNPVQIAVAAAPEAENILIMAGPGSGKTRVVVHRCAYLLRIVRAKPSSILVLCFNRNAVCALRTQLRSLVGVDSNGVTIQTYHGLALRLTGRSMAVAAEINRDIEQSLVNVIKDASDLLSGKTDLPEFDNSELRERLLGSYRHVLVDEYQDIDEDQYRLVSALAGRTAQDPDTKLSILAVGDDDQNIYQFRGSNTVFIKRFQEDYQATVHYLLENYRSTDHIISASNALIELNRDRIKENKAIRINRSRESLQKGGRWTRLDPFTAGRVQIVDIDDDIGQAQAIMRELKRLKRTDIRLKWEDCAVLAREWSVLGTIRALCEQNRIEVSLCLPATSRPPLFRIREIAEYLKELRRMEDDLSRASHLIQRLNSLHKDLPSNPWHNQLHELLEEWKDETDDAHLPVKQILDHLLEALCEQRRNPRIGKGVFLSTAHAVKGLEFPHVLVADGGWRRGKKEEERRLYYVAMTRARETLTLMQRRDDRNPFLDSLQGNFLLRRNDGGEKPPSTEISPCHFAVLGMKDLNLGFAGHKPDGHPIHRVLASLNPGTILDIRQRGDKIILEKSNCTVAVLSKAATIEWSPKLALIRQVSVVAMVQRSSLDGNSSIRSHYEVDRWEVPLVEIYLRSPKATNRKVG